MRRADTTKNRLSGAPLLVVKDLVGHSFIEMTVRYAHLAPDQARNAVQLLLTFVYVSKNSVVVLYP